MYEGKLIDNDKPVVDLAEANFAGADLSSMFLLQSDLTGANLTKADFTGSMLAEANLSCASPFSFEAPSSDRTFYRCANLSDSVLIDVFMPGANLSDANLKEAKLMAASLFDANLSGADLTDAQVTEEQLEQAESLQGATMPNGQKYEDWLKSKGCGEDGENSGPS